MRTGRHHRLDRLTDACRRCGGSGREPLVPVATDDDEAGDPADSVVELLAAMDARRREAEAQLAAAGIAPDGETLVVDQGTYSPDVVPSWER